MRPVPGFPSHQRPGIRDDLQGTHLDGYQTVCQSLPVHWRLHAPACTGSRLEFRQRRSGPKRLDQRQGWLEHARPAEHVLADGLVRDSQDRRAGLRKSHSRFRSGSRFNGASQVAPGHPLDQSEAPGSKYRTESEQYLHVRFTKILFREGPRRLELAGEIKNALQEKGGPDIQTTVFNAPNFLAINLRPEPRQLRLFARWFF